MVGGGGGGGGGSRGPRNNLSRGIQLVAREKRDLVNPFPSLAGSTNTQGWNGNARWTYGKGQITNSLSFTYNHNRTSTTNLYSGVTDVAGNAGITGSFHGSVQLGTAGNFVQQFHGLQRADAEPRTRPDLYDFRHGDLEPRKTQCALWRRLPANPAGISFRAKCAKAVSFLPALPPRNICREDAQPVPGTGNDFADFLLGLPQQTSLQSGTTDYEFRANSLRWFRAG